MNPIEQRTVQLTEFEVLELARSALPSEIADAIYSNYSNYIDIDFPSPKTGGKWRLTQKGWVGRIPVSPELCLALNPKVEIANLFRMLEYAFRLDLKIMPGLYDAASLAEFYERLAHILALRVLDRARKGLYRAYVPECDDLPYVRGRLEPNHLFRKPWDPSLRCEFQEHTADIDENRILLWTFGRIIGSGLCAREVVLQVVRRAYRVLQGAVSLEPQSAGDCLNILYNRLNEDYEPLHALCRFLLEKTGPSHDEGGQQMLPFLIDMSRLFEVFVFEWLKTHLGGEFSIKAQETVRIEKDGVLKFVIDIVLYDRSGKPVAVLDTKYKKPETPGTGDIAQVVAYAESVRCREALLIYPSCRTRTFDAPVGDISVHSLSFNLDGDLEANGWAFRRALLNKLSPAEVAEVPRIFRSRQSLAQGAPWS